jgi:hypothetical protein
MLLIHFDSLDQATDDLPPCLKIRLLQPIVHFGGKGFQASYHETQLLLQLSLGLEVFDLGFQVLQPGAHPGHARFKFLLVDQTLGITIDQPRYPSAQLVYLGFQALVRIRLLLGVQALPVGLLQAFWLRQQPADLVPDRGVRLVHTQSFIPTYALKTVPRNIHGACAAVIRMACGIGASTIRIPALVTNEQALQHVAAAFLGETCAPSVLI